MIIGIGVDLCEVSRLRELEERYGDRFLRRVFTETELKRCSGRRHHECLAGRFAAKEAALKALGTGLSHGIAWRDVELTRGEYQAPTIAFHRRAREIFERLGASRVVVSVSHDGGMAMATVILEGEGR
ncbi:MAG TPA: holo-ACP synthase [Candidatus Krumholzibacteria bacterium]|nr:holo-ACP synthase [Candidatus Krumholzibacteria bacterium]